MVSTDGLASKPVTLRALAVATATRPEVLPDFPTVGLLFGVEVRCGSNSTFRR